MPAAKRAFVPVDASVINDNRPVFTGDNEKWRPSAAMTLTRDTPAVEFFLLLLPLDFWTLVTINSNKYQGFRWMQDPLLYASAQPITLSKMLLYLAALLLSGLSVVPASRLTADRARNTFRGGAASARTIAQRARARFIPSAP
jgi:hypothetical protein